MNYRSLTDISSLAYTIKLSGIKKCKEEDIKESIEIDVLLLLILYCDHEMSLYVYKFIARPDHLKGFKVFGKTGEL